MNEKFPNYGGQALIEGVMMRGANIAVTAMRAPDNEIVIQSESLSAIYRSKLSQIPFLRGLVILWDALVLGTRALTRSANVQTGDDDPIEGPTLYITLFISLALGIVLFFLTPAFIGQLTERYLNWHSWISNLVEGVLRLLIFVGYIIVIGNLPEIKRVFAYHGAEHKTINAFENGADLSPEIVASYSVEHPRCGTSFTLTLVLISILLFSLLGPLPLGWRLASRVLLLPVLACIAYEYIRWTSKHMDNPIIRLIVKPNFALQGLTTREPTLDMLEVSIAAFKEMYRKESESFVDVT
jgi:uncharacterized protein YqhQ